MVSVVEAIIVALVSSKRIMILFEVVPIILFIFLIDDRL